MTKRRNQNKQWREQQIKQKQIEELKECTFKPEITLKNKYLSKEKIGKKEEEKSDSQSRNRKVRPTSQNKITSGYKKYKNELINRNSTQNILKKLRKAKINTNCMKDKMGKTQNTTIMKNEVEEENNNISKSRSMNGKSMLLMDERGEKEEETDHLNASKKEQVHSKVLGRSDEENIEN